MTDFIFDEPGCADVRDVELGPVYPSLYKTVWGRDGFCHVVIGQNAVSKDDATHVLINRSLRRWQGHLEWVSIDEGKACL